MTRRQFDVVNRQADRNRLERQSIADFRGAAGPLEMVPPTLMPAGAMM